MAIAMTAHGLNGNPVADGYMVFLTKVIHLREQVSVGLVGVAYRLMTGKDEETMNLEECGVWNEECGMWSVECGVRSVD